MDDESGVDDKVELSLSLVVKHSSRERCRACKVSETLFNVVNQLTTGQECSQSQKSAERYR